MSWTCPHQEGEHCKKRQRPCEAGAKGCVLEGKFAFSKNEKQQEEAGSTVESGNFKNRKPSRRRGDRQ
jgi:hypothetical protein